MWRCLQIHLTRCGQEIVMHKYSTEIIEACVYTSVYLDMYKKTILILISINCLCYKSPKSKASIAIDQKLGLRFRKIVVWQNSREPAGNLLAICHIPPKKIWGLGLGPGIDCCLFLLVPIWPQPTHHQTRHTTLDTKWLKHSPVARVVVKGAARACGTCHFFTITTWSEICFRKSNGNSRKKIKGSDAGLVVMRGYGKIGWHV